jgi:hypothetical protein
MRINNPLTTGLICGAIALGGAGTALAACPGMSDGSGPTTAAATTPTTTTTATTPTTTSTTAASASSTTSKARLHHRHIRRS